jgi:hypothetical protein
MRSAIALTQDLVRFNTVNPPGRERACAERLAGLLEGAGFTVELIPFGEGRAQLVARIGAAADRPPIGFTGHLDTVPLGAQPWSVDPFAGEIADGKLYGRGSSDMKGGVAAFVAVITNSTRALVADQRPVAGRLRHHEGTDRTESDLVLHQRRGAGAAGLLTCRALAGGGNDRRDRARLDAGKGRERHLQGGARGDGAAGLRVQCGAPRGARRPDS